MDPEEYRKKLEIDILKIIEDKLTKGEMDPDRAKEIAKMLLDKLHPPLTLEEIYKIAPTLDDHFIELTSAVLPVIQEHNEKLKQIVSSHAEKLIKLGKIEEAHNMIKKGIENQTS